ncbi:L-serine ammonia-lyase, iron-sulfur-dependent subunit beta [Aminipila sp.]|uniref:L-serine ammonia-lyase, iron-sulfur-dependent subunit beta n=1 Tax=Aminipila sp. TaxID=2060095 RepID=UPI001DC904FE|nr:L-serine ammonia-lyase, iron-sulfur-dependent subunit beta [Aminipila sp.]MBE6033517.1 L-serine ammonia-lyase, iron-sulfur-dependent, subunit beta [Clostridiales bacterium]
MNTSIFQVAGPIMIGPSSSHTAGAAKIGRIARQIVNADFDKVTFGLHGSFDKTGKGHGTDKALLAGVIGIREDDENISKSFELASEKGIEFEFYSVELDGAHENSVVITFYKKGELRSKIQGASVGGGNVRIEKIDGYEIGISGELPTIFVKQDDQKGVISHVATILADNGINIATMKVSRMQKSKDAICVIEIDDSVDTNILEKLKLHPHIQLVRLIACA